MRPSERAARAADACVARFGGKAFDPASNRDCVKLAAHCLHAQGIATPRLKGLKYRTVEGAARHMKRLGFRDLVEAVDDLGLVSTTLGRALPGFIIAIPTERTLFGPAALGICLSNTEAFGFLEGVAQSVIVHDHIKVWRTF